jgi:XTP/dITP diphosphohydrolase
MIRLLIATRNRHKVEEIAAILGDKLRYLTLMDTPGAPEVIEDAGTFAGNATKKAVELAKWLAQTRHQESQLQNEEVFVLADDSGLEVDALNGEPGVHSARFAALDAGTSGNSSTAANNAKLLRLMQNVPFGKRSARFRCVLALTPLTFQGAELSSPVGLADEPEMRTQLFEGVCEGRIEFEPRGLGGFGYDPLFVPAGYEQTLAELGEGIKNGISHRARALEQARLALRV